MRISDWSSDVCSSDLTLRFDRRKGQLMDATRRESAKAPRTARGQRTLRKLLDAAAVEFGEKGFHEASISSITRRAGVALGSFYTYFDSKDALFQALVRHMSEAVMLRARDATNAQ